MRLRVKAACLMTVCALPVAACSSKGGTSPAGNGVVQISAFVVNPLTFQCAPTPSNPPVETAAPDSLAMLVTMINTTHSDVTLTSAGSYATVVRSSDPADLGTSTMVYASLPYRSTTSTIPALTGQVSFTLMVPTVPLCRSKPLGYIGTQDVDLTARMTLLTGQYVTLPAMVHVQWLAN